MNPYDIASGRVEVDKPVDADKVEAERILQDQKVLWMQHPNTKELIKYLSESEHNYAFSARMYLNEPNEMSKHLIQSLTYGEVLNYVCGRN